MAHRSRPTPILVGETPKETLHNLGCALQVLADASLQEGQSDELTRGWWLLLQTLTEVARSGAQTPEGRD